MYLDLDGVAGISVGALRDGDGDGVVSAADPPSVVVGGAVESAYFVALEGIDGDLEWRSGLDGLSGFGTALLADLDADGFVEVIAASGEYGDPPNVVASLRGDDGVERWRTGSIDVVSLRSDPASAADLDDDGRAEVIIGSMAFDAKDGALQFFGPRGSGGTPAKGGGIWARQSFAADVLPGGGAEVVAGYSVYDATGAEVLTWPDVPESHATAADFDGDGELDFLFVQKEQMWGGDLAGALVWGPRDVAGGCYTSAGPVAIEDLDGDGLPEFVVPCREALTAYTWGGDVLWSVVVEDMSSAAGAAIADLDGDGRAEVAFGDQHRSYVFAGATGALRWSEARLSATGIETPVFADIDLDGRIEMITASDGEVRAYRANPAGPGRPIWNSHSYHITDVNDDMTVDASEPYWLTTNSFRSAGLGEVLPARDPYPVLVDVCEDRCDEGRVEIYAVVANGGVEAVEAGLEVVVRAGPRGPVIAREWTPDAIPGLGTSALLTFDVAAAALAGQPPAVEVDPSDLRAQCLTRADDDVTVAAAPACLP